MDLWHGLFTRLPLLAAWLWRGGHTGLWALALNLCLVLTAPAITLADPRRDHRRCSFYKFCYIVVWMVSFFAMTVCHTAHPLTVQDQRVIEISLLIALVFFAVGLPIHLSLLRRYPKTWRFRDFSKRERRLPAGGAVPDSTIWPPPPTQEAR